MDIAIIVLSVIAGLAALVLIIAAFVKKDYAVYREIEIVRPKPEVYDYIKFLKNQDNFSVWATMDPAMRKTYTGTDGTPGFVSAWASDNKKVGKGEQTIISLVENERVNYQLHFIEPWEGKAGASLSLTETVPGITKVTWRLDSHMKYPMNIMLLFMNMDRLLGKDLRLGLDNLKVLLEKR
ncbi:polyketide cyclase [Pedobacter sp. HMF7056]|uniref:Polyketide cyclase n=2 Tax=Hufsiella ginkgonis TaxID=2695274 RepID=A0A7K1Y3P2_9SPHI|nr:polyketide cyclase [Hufsiella ginkgonis]